jgi:hypothetical protein
MRNLIKVNGTYGTKIGGKIACTKQGAIDIYKAFLAVCYKDLSAESTSVLSNAEADMIQIGFTYEELEEIETEYLKTL